MMVMMMMMMMMMFLRSGNPRGAVKITSIMFFFIIFSLLLFLFRTSKWRCEAGNWIRITEEKAAEQEVKLMEDDESWQEVITEGDDSWQEVKITEDDAVSMTEWEMVSGGGTD